MIFLWEASTKPRQTPAAWFLSLSTSQDGASWSDGRRSGNARWTVKQKEEPITHSDCFYFLTCIELDLLRMRTTRLARCCSHDQDLIWPLCYSRKRGNVWDMHCHRVELPHFIRFSRHPNLLNPDFLFTTNAMFKQRFKSKKRSGGCRSVWKQ
ncbi:hypothetical protein VTK73DRAFT_6134 [Phialemonium thermophilum]|uniref:Uncharacterized protein n=1 Tax=Phialemonium thermophilum TaxID=223376 RepID=A0ABR3WKH7_9PEZI